MEVRRTSQVHQIPHTGRAHRGPVTNTMVQKTTPTSALTTARASARSREKYFLIRKYKPAMARPVVATDDGSMPSGKGRIANAAMQAAIRDRDRQSSLPPCRRPGCGEPDTGWSHEIDEEQQERRPRRRHMVVEDALHIAHGLFGGSGHQRLIERDSSAGPRSARRRWGKPFHSLLHSAFNTSSNNSRQAIVNTTS